MILTALVISSSHVYRLKSGDYFALKVVNSEDIQHIIFKSNGGAQFSVENGKIYEFTDLKNAVIKGISVFMATESTELTIIQGVIEEYYPKVDAQIFPEDDFSYEGVVSEVLFEGSLYSLDEGRVHLYTVYLATAIPNLSQNSRVLVEHAHINKKQKPYRLVCCGLSKIRQLGDQQDQNEYQINQVIRLVHEYGWNVSSFERVLEVVKCLRIRLYPKFLNQDEFYKTQSKLKNSIINTYGILEILFCCYHLYPDVCPTEETREQHSPLKDFLNKPHCCCAINGIEKKLLPDIKFISVNEAAHLSLNNQENIYIEFSSWKYKEAFLDICLNKVVLVGFLGALADGTPCLVDNSGTILCIISYNLESSESDERDHCPVHHHFPPPRPYYGQLVAVSRFLVISEICKVTGESNCYLLLKENDLTVLKTTHLGVSRPNFMGGDTENLCLYYLCLLIIPRVKVIQKNEKGLYRCSIDTVIISNALVEVAFKDNCDTLQPSQLEMPDFFLDEDCRQVTLLEQKHRKKFILEDPMQVQQSSSVIPGRPYLLEVPLSNQPDVASTLVQRFTAPSTCSLLLESGTRINPFTRHISQLCSRHSLKESTRKFRLLTDDCICSLANPKITPIPIIKDENFFSEEHLNIDCILKEKWITIEDAGTETCLSVSNYDSLESSNPSSVINVYLKTFSKSFCKFQGLIPGRRLLVSALIRVRSQLGNVYLKATQETFLQHLSMEDDRMTKKTLNLPMRVLSALPLDYQWFDSLATIVKIYSVCISFGNGDPDLTISDLDIKATFLLDDGTEQAEATCKDYCVQNLLLLQDQEWNFLLFLARNNPQGLHFDQADRWRQGVRCGASDRLLRGLCLRPKVRRQSMVTCRQIGHKFSGSTQDGAIKRKRKLLCSNIQLTKPGDVILRLLRHLNVNT